MRRPWQTTSGSVLEAISLAGGPDSICVTLAKGDSPPDRNTRRLIPFNYSRATSSTPSMAFWTDLSTLAAGTRKTFTSGRATSFSCHKADGTEQLLLSRYGMLRRQTALGD